MSLLNQFNWLEEGQVLGCVYPRNEVALAELAGLGVTLLINLHETPHQGSVLARHGLTQLHLPVRDFTAPSPYQLEQGIRAIQQTLAEGGRVAVHCAAGIGRTGTLLACYLVHGGLNAQEAIARVRAARPGSVEVSVQRRAVHEYERRLREQNSTSS